MMIEKKDTKLKMLLVDIDPDAREKLCILLSPYGSPVVVLDEKEAISRFRSAVENNEPYDLLFIDSAVPGLDTMEILEQIRKTEANKSIHALDGVKIIMTTTPTTPETEQRATAAFKSGCEGYLKKPVDEKKLINLLKTLFPSQTGIFNKKEK
ncbi:MAG: response regulator [bacterium]|nr:response regulator [bacterium]